MVRHLREKTRLRNEFMEQVRNVLPPLGRKGLLIPGAAAERDDYYFSLLCNILSAHKGAGTHDRSSQSHSSRIAQEITPVVADMLGEFPRTDRSPAKNICREYSPEWRLVDQLKTSPYPSRA
jgi:hypothetical protein